MALKGMFALTLNTHAVGWCADCDPYGEDGWAVNGGDREDMDRQLSECYLAHRLVCAKNPAAAKNSDEPKAPTVQGEL